MAGRDRRRTVLAARLAGDAADGLPWILAAGRLAARQIANEIFGAPGYVATLARPKAEGFAVGPRDFRPVDPEQGKAVLAGRFILAGSVLDAHDRVDGRDPWSRPSPTRRFAVELHRFEWLAPLLSTGERGARTALSLILAWSVAFGRWSPFAWGHETLSRRVFNLACASRRLVQVSSDADRARLADTLARQARQVLRLPDDPAHAAQHLAAAAVAGTALSGKAGEGILRRALKRLMGTLDRTVLPDGTHASRSPEAGLELLLDLLTLDDALLQRGDMVPQGITATIERLTRGLRVLTLADGRLASVQGGEASSAARVEAAGAHLDGEDQSQAHSLADGRYERLQGQLLQVFMDVGAPAGGAYSAEACAQPLALEIVCGRDRIVTNGGWSPRAPERQGFRLTAAASTVTLGEASVLDTLSGPPARVLGPRLQGPPLNVARERQDGEGVVLVEARHDGWAAPFGLMCERRLFLDVRLDELKGEDRLWPAGDTEDGLGERARPGAVPVAARFHLEAGVQASLARDRKSVLLRGAAGRGWWFRTDAADVAIEPTVRFENGLTRRSLQIVLRGTASTNRETRIRWKLSPAGAAGEWLDTGARPAEGDGR